jgi:hypothetical protein
MGNGKAGSVYTSHSSRGPQLAGNDVNDEETRHDLRDPVDPVIGLISMAPGISDKLTHFPLPMQLQSEIDPLPIFSVVDQTGQLEHNPPVEL